MRRRDFISLGLLGVVALAAGQQLKPPVLDNGPATIDDEFLTSYISWSGPVDRVLVAASRTGEDVSGEASDEATGGAAGEPEVKGASIDLQALSAQKPQSLLPVETYYASPMANNLSAVLKAKNIEVYPEDIIETNPPISLGLGSVIKIYRATPVEIIDWGKKNTYRTWQTTVEAVLAEQSMELGDNDRVNPSPSSPILLGTDGKLALLTITRVAVTEIKEKEKIEYKKVEKEDPNLPRGQVRVEKGAAGERVKTFQVTRENGVEVKRVLLKNEVTKEPVDETRIVGTKVVIGKTYTGRASWYKYNSTKVATDLFKRGVQLRITNLANGKVIFVKNDGCICADTGYVVDLHPDHFVGGLGGKLTDGVLKNVRVDEVLN